MKSILISLILLLSALALILAHSFLQKRYRRVLEFREECFQKVLSKKVEEYHIVLGINQLEYMDGQYRKFVQQSPSYAKMLFSTRPLWTKYWYTPDQRLDLFGEIDTETF